MRTFNQKLSFVKMHEEGKPLCHIEREYHVDRKVLREWVRRYKLYGERGLERKPYAHTSYEDKCEAVCAFVEGRATYSELMSRYDISHSLIKKWVQKYRKEGSYEALRNKSSRAAAAS